MENHGERPELIRAKKTGYGEVVRFSETLSEQTFYCAVELENGNILRVPEKWTVCLKPCFPALPCWALLPLEFAAVLGIFPCSETDKRSDQAN